MAIGNLSRRLFLRHAAVAVPAASLPAVAIGAPSLTAQERLEHHLREADAAAQEIFPGQFRAGLLERVDEDLAERARLLAEMRQAAERAEAYSAGWSRCHDEDLSAYEAAWQAVSDRMRTIQMELGDVDNRIMRKALKGAVA